LLLPPDNGDSFLGLEGLKSWAEQAGGHREPWGGKELAAVFVCTRLTRAGGERFLLCYYYFVVFVFSS
jgi:hypothetical protein